MLQIVNSPLLKIATDCSGIGSPEQALKNMDIPHQIIFACEKDKYARQTYQANHQCSTMFTDMTLRNNSLPNLYADLYCAGIPCQAFSLSGLRLGEQDPKGRGILFYNFYDYVKRQQPKAFLLENVPGLISDKKGQTFRNWLELLAATINGQHQLHAHADNLGYNIHWALLNSKHFGVPQNRSRVFIVGIRPDLKNTFQFPKGFKLNNAVPDILETNVDQKYYLSEKAIQSIILNPNNLQKSKINPQIANTLQSPGNAAGIYKGANKVCAFDTIINSQKVVVNDKGNLREIDGNTTCLTASYHKGHDNHGGRSMIVETYDLTTDEQSIIGYTRDAKGKVIKRTSKQIAGTIHTSSGGGGNTDQFVNQYSRIRRLTPLECFRLQGFPDNFIKPVSDTQLYKQAGNTITTTVLQAIFKNLLPIINA